MPVEPPAWTGRMPAFTRVQCSSTMSDEPPTVPASTDTTPTMTVSSGSSIVSAVVGNVAVAVVAPAAIVTLTVMSGRSESSAVPPVIPSVIVMSCDDGFDRLIGKTASPPSVTVTSSRMTLGAASSSTIVPVPTSVVSPTGPASTDATDMVSVSSGSSVVSKVVGTENAAAESPAAIVTAAVVGV